MLKSLWTSGTAGSAVFLADYAINPLGVKDDLAIAEVADRWVARAAAVSDTLVIACNTLSIRYHQLRRTDVPTPGLVRVVSMVDCFEAMVKEEGDRLSNANVLIFGTEFTASQALYSDILDGASLGSRVKTVAATRLERTIARFERWDVGEDLFTDALKASLDKTDIAILACTCFPMVKDELEALYPDVVFLDPGAYCSDILKKSVETQSNKLSVEVTGTEVSAARVIEYARSYLGDSSIGS